jgi:hemerythrin
MPILEWNESFNLGIERFDIHHRHLVDLLNRAHDDYLEDARLDRLAATLHELFEDALRHFQVAEKYMEETNYAGVTEYLEYHKNFSRQAAAMERDLTQVWKNLPKEMLTFLKNWLTYDICKADAEYARFLMATDIRRCA